MKFDAVPKPGDLLFTTGGQLDIDLNFMRFSSPHGRYIRAFRLGADCILKELHGNANELNNGHLFISLAYLHRHCIELQLKSIIRYANLLKDAAVTDNQLYTHDVKKLWELVRPILEKKYPSDKKHFPAIGKVIVELHVADPDGEDFRFPDRREKKNRPASASMEAIPRTFSLDKFAEAVASVEEFLEYIIDGYDAYYDAMTSEYHGP